MPMPLPKPRHTIEKSDNLVRVMLPTKKNIISILGAILWLFVWVYMTFALLYITLSFNMALAIGKNSTPPVQPGIFFTMVGIFFVLFLLVLLAIGAFGIYRFIWLLVGKEVIEVNSEVLRISTQTFLGKNAKDYSVREVKDLRVDARHGWFSPLRRLQRMFGSTGMIAFDYEAKIFRFGLGIDEAEAKQIILAIKDGLPQQSAG